MKEIPLTQGKVTFVDDEDYEWISAYKWYAYKHPQETIWYAARSEYQPHLKQPRMFRMHREIMCPDPGVAIDHRDGNGLNNCRSNLRIDFNKFNRANSVRSRNNTSGFKGVSFDKKHKKFHARIGRIPRNSLGFYETAIEAAIAYDDAAFERYGEYARPNFPFVVG